MRYEFPLCRVVPSGAGSGCSFTWKGRALVWTKLDDALLDHRKVFIAGDIIGRNGAAIAIGLYAIGLTRRATRR